MKKVVTLLLILFVSSGLYGLSFSTSLSLRTADEGNKYDYQLVTDFEYKDIFSAMLEYERENGKYTLDYITASQQNWKYLKVKFKRTRLQGRKNEVYVEALGRYPIEQKKLGFWLVKIFSNGHWELGFRQRWKYQDSHYLPSSMIVAGKTYTKTLKFFLVPAHFSYSLNYASANGKRWTPSSEVKLDFSLIAYVDYFLKYLLEGDWVQFKTGIKIKI